MARPYNKKKKKRKKEKEKRIYKIVDFAVPADHRIKLKECEKKDKYLDLARELKKQWNMKVTIVPIVIGAFGTITKGLLKGLKDLEVGGRVRLSKWQHFWERPEYWEESWILEETCCHSNSREKPSANTDVKNAKGVNNNNNNNNDDDDDDDNDNDDDDNNNNDDDDDDDDDNNSNNNNNNNNIPFPIRWRSLIKSKLRK